MIVLTQLIYIHSDQEENFLKFESIVLPLMANYGGKLLSRLRPDDQSFIEGELEKPYEVHLVSFPTENDLKAYLNDETRQQYLHLKDQSVREVILYKGARL